MPDSLSANALLSDDPHPATAVHSDALLSDAPQHNGVASNALLSDAPATAKTSPAATKAAAPPTFETPKGARPNPLRTASDALEMGFAVPNAFLRQDHNLLDVLRGRGDYTDLKKVVEMMRHGKFQEASDEYGIGATPQLQWQAARGDWLSQQELAHSKLRGLVTGAGEFLNPANIATGEIAGAALRYGGMGLKTARAASPVLHDSLTALEGAGADAARPFVRAAGAVARPIAKAAAPIVKPIMHAGAAINDAAQQVRNVTTTPAARLLDSFFSKYGDLRNAAGDATADAARGLDKRKAIVQREIENLTGHVFDGLTSAQKREVVRLSAVDERNNRLYAGNPGVAAPKQGLSLTDRADLYRGAYNRITPLLQRYGLLNETTFKTGLYDPRKNFGRPIAATDTAKGVEGGEQPAFVPTTALDRAGAGGSGGIGAGAVKKANRGHRSEWNQRPMYQIPDAELHQDYDPAHHFFHDLLEKHTSLANEIGRGRLERVAPVDTKGAPKLVDPQFGQPVFARTPTKYANPETGEFFGYGAEGQEAFEKHLKDLADERATKATNADFTVKRAAKELNLTPAKVGDARGLKARIFATKSEIREASRARQTFGNLADYVTNKYAATSRGIGGELYKSALRQSRRVDKLNAQIESVQQTAKASAGMARARQFAQMVDERERETERLATIVERVERAASPVGLSAKSGYESAFNLIDELPTQLAAKLRPLLEGASAKPNAQTLEAAQNMLRSASTPEAEALKTELTRLATRATTGKIDDLTDSINAIRMPDVERSLAGIERANERRVGSMNTAIDNAVGKSTTIQTALRSNNAQEAAAAKDLVQQLKDASALKAGRPDITGHPEVDQYLYESAQDRGRNPAYIERFANVEDAAGNYDRTVRVSGNADRAKETHNADFTPNDITHARKFMAEHFEKVPDRKTILDYLQRAMAFDMHRSSDLAALVEQYGSAPDAVRKIGNALRTTMGEYQRGSGAVAGATDAAKPLADVSGKLRADNERFAERLAQGAEQIRNATPGGAGYNNAMKRIGAIARAAQEAPAQAGKAATRGALEAQAGALARVARAGVDQAGQRIVADLHNYAQQAEREVQRVWDDIYGKRDKLARPAEDAMYAAEGKAHSAMIRERLLREKKETLEQLRVAHENYDRIYQQQFDKSLSALRHEYAGTEQHPAGYVKEVSGSPTGGDKWLHPELAEFLNAKGSAKNPTGMMKGLTEAYAALNAMSRAGLVWLPIAHAIPNLGTHFLKTGGSMPRMIQILSGQAKFDAGLVARAEKAGATSEATSVAFHPQAAHERYTATSELADEASRNASAALSEKATKVGLGKVAASAGPVVGKVAAAATHARAAMNKPYQGMNKWLFDKVERSYRIDYFDRLTRKGGEYYGREQAAARAVDAAFGKVGDVSEHEKGLSRLFYFYSWMKTVVPFWLKHGLVDPQFWNAPVRGTQVNNQAQGYDDPSRPFTATLGKRSNGQWRRYKEFMPQSVLEPMSQLARIPFERNIPDALGDLYAPIHYVGGHLNTFLSLLQDLSEAAAEYAKSRKPAPFNAFYIDPSKTLPQNVGAIGASVAGRAVGPFEQFGRAVADPAMAGSIVTGGFSYGVPTTLQAEQRKEVQRRYGPAIADAVQRGDGAYLRELYAKRAATLNSYAQPQPSPTPAGLGGLYSQPR